VEDYWEITGDYWRLLGDYWGLLEITGDYTTHSSCMLSSPRIGGKLDRPRTQEVATISDTPPVFQNKTLTSL